MSVRVPSGPRKRSGSDKPSGIRLRLYITGATNLSLKAIANIRTICRENLVAHNPDLEIIDLYQSPSAARSNQIFAAPTLIKELPLPMCRIIGDLSKKDRVLNALGFPSPPVVPTS